MHARPSRLAAGTLLLALPLAAAAGCGAAKKRTIKQELVSARSHLAASSADAFTLRLDDAKGSLAKAATKDGSLTAAAAKDLLGSSITVTVDAASATSIKSVSPGASESELKADLAKARFALQIKDAKATVAEIRLVDSTLFARVDVAEIDRVATEAGQDGVAQNVDDFIASAPREYQPALRDAKAGKWMKLPLADYIGKLKDVTKALPTPGPSAGTDGKKLENDVLTAVKPYVKVTDANDSSSDRVLDVKVDVRGAVKALLGVAKTTKGLPFADQIGAVDPAEVDKNVKSGTANGTIRLADGHLKQVAVDLGSSEALDASSDTHALAGSRLVVDVDDSADEVAAPTSNLSDVDVKALIDDLFQNLTQTFGGLTGDVSS